MRLLKMAVGIQRGRYKHIDESSLFCAMQVADELNPLRVLGLLQRISTEDCGLLDLASRPEDLLMTHVPVAPVCIRPSVEMDTGGSNEDDITIKLMVCGPALLAASRGNSPAGHGDRKTMGACGMEDGDVALLRTFCAPCNFVLPLGANVMHRHHEK